MKFQTSNNAGQRASTAPWQRLLKAALAVMLPLFLGMPLQAQCDLACNGGNPDVPLLIPVDDNCQVSLTPEDVLEVPITCPGDKVLTVRDEFNNLIVEGVNMVVFDPIPYTGQTLSVMTTDVVEGIFCNSFIRAVDVSPPVIECVNDTISCIADTSVAVLGLPAVSDNCSSDISIAYFDNYNDFTCVNSFAAFIERLITAEDEQGNQSSCSQLIFLDRPDLNDVAFPQDTVLNCGVTDLSPAVTNQPRLEGMIIEQTNRCDLSVTFRDDTLMLCGNIEFQIQRTWTVTEACTQTMATDIQLINVVDTIAPQIICPGPITVNTNTGACYATVNLPSPSVLDNCDADASFVVSTTYGAVGTGPHPFVPVGTHTLQYTARDQCNNSRTCTTTLNVVDQEPPTAVCEETLIVSVSSGGVGVVDAISFDGGSNDNCAPELFFKARRMVTGACDGLNGDDSDAIAGYQEWFDDEVRFCCDELDAQDLQVILRVYEVDPGSGPVQPVRELPNGDLFGRYTECMVNVEVQDKVAPDVACPQNMTIDCREDYSDLSIFGEAMAMDNCSAELSLEEEIQVDDCGTGTITRTYTAIDPSGNIGGCIQTITIVNESPFSLANIDFPEDITIEICGAATDPDDLPDGFDRPILSDVGCASIGINYSDEFFDISFPACYKILREWVILDWCQYDPEDPNTEGRFSDVQVIKVEDNTKPILSCPEDVVVGLGPDCNASQVNLLPVMAEDCSSNVLITNNSPFADVAGANASGEYPSGTTLVTFVASDRCGNTASCQVSVTVEDMTPPQPVCIVGLSVNLAMMNGEPMAMINAPAFNGGSSDNCTDANLLKYSIRRAGTGLPGVRPTTTQLTFTCEDAGGQPIEFWAEDNAGNSSFCVTVIAVQDNNNICPAAASGMIAGEISTEMGEYVEGVMVEVMSDDPLAAFTGDNGFFELLGVPFGNNYTLRPYRDEDVLNGVSTLDLLLISRHILGVAPLNTPYKMIAADVNRSGAISTLDLIALRKLILGIEVNLPNGNTSWRFVDANHLFLNPNNPFATPFPEMVNINGFEQDHMDANFVAIKVGDVDVSASANDYGMVEERDPQGTMVLNVPDVSVQAGQEFTLPFTTAGLNEILGYQFTLRYNTELLEYVELIPGTVPNMSEGNYNLLRTQDGWITTSWNVMDIVPQEEMTELFAVTFRAREDIESLEDLLSVTSIPTREEAYNMEGDVLDITLNFGQAITATGSVRVEGYELYQNRPNPFSAHTVIGFKLPIAGEAKITVYDMAGQVLYNQEGYYAAGTHEIVIKGTDLSTSGLLYYQLRTANYAATKKMILME